MTNLNLPRAGFKVTKDMLRSWGACASGYSLFMREFPSGEADVQDVLDAAARLDKISDALWLMQKVGALNVIAEIEAIDGENNVFFAGTLVVKAGVNISGWLLAGGDIEAGRGITAGRSIWSGGGIKAGWGIEAADGIEAGSGITASLPIKPQWINCRYQIFTGFVNWRRMEVGDDEIHTELRGGEVAAGKLITPEIK